MPARNWRFYCDCHERGFRCAWPTCSCGEPGIFDGVYLTAMEAMWAHGRVFGLKPMGYHSALERQIMGPLFRECDVCEGRGTVGIGSPFDYDWDKCPLCDGNQLVPNVPREQIVAARQQVLAVYPDAAWAWKE